MDQKKLLKYGLSAILAIIVVFAIYQRLSSIDSTELRVFINHWYIYIWAFPITAALAWLHE